MWSNNLLKCVRFGETAEVCVIDSNKKVEEKLEQIQQQLRNNMDAQDDETTGFVEGLDPILVNELVEEENVNYEQQAAELLEIARADAEAIRQAAMEEAEKIKAESWQAAKMEGYRAGKEEAMIEAAQLKSEFQIKQMQLEQEYSNKLAQMEPMLVQAMLPVFEKVTKVLSTDKEDLILHLVNSALERAESSKEFYIRVSRQDYPYLSEHKEEIKCVVGEGGHVEVIEDIALLPNQCLIETDGGVFDCGLDTQLKGLMEAIRVLSC